MSEDAKKSADKVAEQTGWAENEKVKKPADEEPQKETTETADSPAPDEKKTEEAETSSDKESSEKTTVDASTEKESDDDTSENSDDADASKIEIEIELPDEPIDTKDTKASTKVSVQEQIENCKFEIISELQESIHHEFAGVMAKEIRKVERRRRFGAWVRDIIILLLAAAVGYFGYCLYDVKYFDFMKQDCAVTNTCEEVITNEATASASTLETEEKDTNWYRRKYGYLFDSLRMNLNADLVSAYYLYSDDYKADEIPANYLLAMAYNRLTSNVTYDSEKGIMVPADDLQKAFVRLFGDAKNFVKQDFTYDCAEFTYDKASDSFITPSVQCNSSSNRVIMEEIDEIYEEGNAMYFLTTAAIYDRSETSFYSFDNLFKPVAKHVEKDDFTKYASLMNRYQYQFKKSGDEYIFSSVVKLK